MAIYTGSGLTSDIATSNYFTGGEVGRYDGRIGIDTAYFSNQLKALQEYTRNFNPQSKKPIMKRVIFNEPATIVFWDEKDKTIVKATDDDTYSPEFGFLIAYFEKHSGMSRTQVNKFMKKLKQEYLDQMAAKRESSK